MLPNMDIASTATSNTITKAFVMASGEGSRFGKGAAGKPKTLFTVGGVSLLERNVRLLDQSFTPDVIFLIAGVQLEAIQESAETFQDIHAQVQVIKSVSGPNPGLLRGFATIAGHVKPGESFVVALGDEYYGGGDHDGFARQIREISEYSALCSVKRCSTARECRQNFAVHYSEDTKDVTNIREKPVDAVTDFFGLGLIAAKGVLAHIALEHCSQNIPCSPYELLNDLPGRVLGFEFHDDYININRVEDLHKARDSYRQQRWNSRDLDVVIPALNEEDCIGQVVEDFKAFCSQVIVMDNMSSDQTATKARKAGAIVHTRAMGGYGDAITKGLDLCTASMVAITEADGSFRAHDLNAIVPFLQNADAVMGTRTYAPLVQPGAFMPFPLRMGNMAVGFFLSGLWAGHGARYTDVGCSLRVMWRETYQSIRPDLGGQGPEFAPEVALELMSHGLRVQEVPVSYYPRLGGGSKLSGNYWNSGKTALRMLRLILSKRIKKWVGGSK